MSDIDKQRVAAVNENAAKALETLIEYIRGLERVGELPVPTPDMRSVGSTIVLLCWARDAAADLRRMMAAIVGPDGKVPGGKD